MKPKKKVNTTKSSLTLRIVAGLYLLYLVYSMIKESGQDQESNKAVILIAIIFFSIAAVIILATSIRSMLILNNEEKRLNDSEGPEVQEIEEDIEESPHSIEEKETKQIEETEIEQIEETEIEQVEETENNDKNI